MEIINIIKPDFYFEDERGTLVQLVREGYKQINVIFSNKGVLRGNHFHKINKEAFYIISGKVKVSAEKGDIKEETIFSNGDMFEFEPNVNHSFEYLEDTWLVSMYSLGVELSDGRKDIYKYE